VGGKRAARSANLKIGVCLAFAPLLLFTIHNPTFWRQAANSLKRIFFGVAYHMHPGKSFLSGRLITSDKFQISGIPENKCINLSETTILAETSNFRTLKFKVSAKIIVSDRLISIFSGMPEI
jgi:hypothetical protein